MYDQDSSLEIVYFSWIWTVCKHVKVNNLIYFLITQEAEQSYNIRMWVFFNRKPWLGTTVVENDHHDSLSHPTKGLHLLSGLLKTLLRTL